MVWPDAHRRDAGYRHHVARRGSCNGQTLQPLEAEKGANLMPRRSLVHLGHGNRCAYFDIALSNTSHGDRSQMVVVVQVSDQEPQWAFQDHSVGRGIEPSIVVKRGSRLEPMASGL